ncbi:MAG: hypothetical protein PHX83_09350 [Acidobacteriia bacterium]|nr:hypothetical protein [Terriglobia bacterium]
MKKLDRLGWAEGLSFSAYGLRIGIRSTRRGTLGRVRGILPFGWKRIRYSTVDRIYSIVIPTVKKNSRVKRYNVLYNALTVLARTMNREDIYTALESDLALYVAGESRREMFVHGAVVGWRGRGIVFPGKSFSGKSTLVAALVKAGATYFSDEYAVMDSKGRVFPYPIQIGLRSPGRDGTLKRFPMIPRNRIARRPVPIGMIVLCNYRKGAQWRPQTCSPGRAALSLLSNAMSAQRNPKKTMRIVQHLVSSVPVLKGIRGEARDVAGNLLV